MSGFEEFEEVERKREAEGNGGSEAWWNVVQVSSREQLVREHVNQ